MILVSHPTGNPYMRSVARAFEEAGWLAEFWTCINWREKSALARWLPRPVLRQLQRRSFPGVPPGKIFTAPARELGRHLASALGWHWLVRHEAGFCSVDAIYHHLDRQIAARLKRTPALRGVYLVEDGALETFRVARKLGVERIYELPIGYWRAAQQIYAEEREREPQWAVTLDGGLDSAEKLARKDEELRLASRVIVASSFTKNTLALAPEIGGPIHVIPYGAPDAAAMPGDGGSIKKLKVIFVGSLGQRKGLSYLLAAIEPLQAIVELTLLGSKPSENCPPLDEAIRRHRWIKSLPHHEVLEEMARHDVLVFPSLFEGFGLVILEAMSRGLPVITTPNTAGPDLIREGEDGFIVPIRSAAAIQEKLEILARDRARLQTMKHAALDTARRCSWKVHRRLLQEMVRTVWPGEAESPPNKRT
jgi:glycosyltransferase involved in cell wall biosynthesis